MKKKQLSIIIGIAAVLLIAAGVYFIFLQKATVFVAFNDQENGYALFIPNSFTQQTAGDNQVLLLSEKPQASINIMMEVGGYNYYTPKELADTVMGRLTAGFSAKQEVRSYRLQAQRYNYRLVENGTNADGAELTLDLVILEPVSGVHYYMLLSTPTAKYKKIAGDWEKVFNSFALTKTEDELYGILKTRAAENEASSSNQKDTQDSTSKDSSTNKTN